MAKFKKGHIPWNKGRHLSEKHKRNLKESHKGKVSGALGKHWRLPKNSILERKNRAGNATGKHWKLSEGFKRKARERIKEKAGGWKGGITPLNLLIRAGFNYKLWRKAVFERDNFTCQKYGIKGGKLVAHHINNFADFPELRLAIDNGITLSKKAHDEFHRIYGKKNNTKEQLEEFLKLK